RCQIIAAARQLFAERGVSRTSLEQVAAAAGVTRGAIYWHFANKTELFYAVRDDAALPLFDRMDEVLLDGADPLAAVASSMLAILDGLESDPKVREIFEVMSLKCEYVGEFAPVLARIYQCSGEWAAKMVTAYTLAREKGLLRPELEPRLLALETQAFMFGLVRLWLMDGGAENTRRQARQLIAAHIAGRRA
ncbi:MAG: hypothetical protein RIR00_2032, partial [Pseudomonadota bacterium]